MRSTVETIGRNSPIVSPDEDLLPKLGQRRDHRAERELRASVAVHDSRSDDGHVRAGVELCHESIHGPSGHARVRIQQEHELGGRGANRAIVRCRKAEIGAGLDQPDRCPPVAHERRRSIRRSVVDHHDVMRGDRRGLCQRSQDDVDLSTGVIGHDDDRESRGAWCHVAAHFAQASRTCSVRRAHSSHEYRPTCAAPASMSRERSSPSASSRSSAAAMRPGSGCATYSAAGP